MLYVWFDLTCITRYFRKLQCSFCTRCFARLKQTNNYFDVSLTMHSIPFVHPPFCCEPPLQFVEVCKEPSAFVLNLLLYQVETNKQIFWCIPPLCIAGALLPFARPPFCCEWAPFVVRWGLQGSFSVRFARSLHGFHVFDFVFFSLKSRA